MIKVKTQSGQVCRLSDAVCITEKPQEVELTPLVRRRLRDGSLIKVENKRGAAK